MARRTLEYACAVLVIGLLAGVAGAATTLLLHAVEHLTYHYAFGTLLTGVGNSSPVRRAVGPMLGGALAGFGWWMLRRSGDVPGLTATIAEHRPIQRLRMSIDAGLQVLLVGAGASLGREGAPRQLAAALGDLATSRLSLTARDREILLACAAGAGLGAVYSVPLGGAVFAARILLGTWHPRAVGTALITSSLAVAVASPVTHLEHTLRWPDPHLSYLFVILAVAIAPLAVAVGLVFDKVMSLARPKPQIRSWTLIPAIAFAGLATGICSIWWPELPGNGRSILTISVGAGLTLGGASVILILKPLLTALFLRTGAVGGMITPAMATGAAAGSVLALALNHVAGTHIQVSALSLTCAAGVLAITQRAPAFAALFVWELARPPYWLLIVFLVAAFTAHGIRLLREQHQAERPEIVS
ncbi:chloride channel protein [Mycobacterium sp. AZCC_0083]|uniref:chloride channel protein n=1 Tax=Mycobacterium sp. AZCC_0083 TaxID=2735882 RepID=UPI001617E2F3|nr:chloride channel protein [Mycobacterium sp. AZCC_0083]MBB5167046.1 H+/Cl- antiporter ClcA [Mycobacterium sp. AZCC_0083]